ncbi:MAG: hypothetical protein K2Y18_02570 [Alphaproteobacteria bacterium]|jgi:hypothetical protein|nr:hypothetical protein [Alphaproteobacteria bacterium]
MRHYVYGLLFASALFSQEAISMQEEKMAISPELHKLLEDIKGIKPGAALDKHLAGIKESNSDHWRSMCKEITDNRFIKISQPAVGNMKAAALGRWCDNYQVVQVMKKSVQGAKVAAAVAEMPKLRPVQLKQGAKGFEAKEQQLKENQKEADERVRQMAQEKDVRMQERAREYEKRILLVRKDIEEARESYDNLSAAMNGLREDFQQVAMLKQFNNEHKHDTAEEFLNAYDAYVKATPNIRNYVQGLDQVDAARIKLKEALTAQERGEEVIAALIKEMNQ